MKLPDAILAKILARFDSLVAEGRNILNGAVDISPASITHSVSTGTRQSDAGSRKLDPEKFVEWRTKAATLLALVVPRDHIHGEAATTLLTLRRDSDELQSAISLLRGIKDDLAKGFLDGIATAIEAEIACDYMGQAQHLLTEGNGGTVSHVPAAVLAGAVLEKGLRTLCSRQKPPIGEKHANGNHKTLGPLIEDLKKAGVITEAKAKQLCAWAAIRNLAAHGEFDQFTRSDVETMIPGVNSFLADFLK